MQQVFLNMQTVTRRNTWRKYVELGHEKRTKNVKNFQRILRLLKITVYLEKYAICTLLENMRNMPRWHIHIKPTCLLNRRWHRKEERKIAKLCFCQGTDPTCNTQRRDWPLAVKRQHVVTVNVLDLTVVQPPTTLLFSDHLADIFYDEMTLRFTLHSSSFITHTSFKNIPVSRQSPTTTNIFQCT